MGASLNICALLVGLAVLSGRAISRSSVPLRKCWFHRLDGVGILALFLSVVSPELIIGPGPDGVFGTSDDDRFQMQLIRPRTRCVTTSTHTRAAQRRSLTNLWMNAFGATGDPLLAPRTRRSFAADRPLERQTFFQAPVAIHSPPIAS
jgi:hypothetical protein